MGISVRSDGFIAYMVQMPADNALLRFWSELTGERWTGYARDIHPTDAMYLWWKLTGIARVEGATR